MASLGTLVSGISFFSSPRPLPVHQLLRAQRGTDSKPQPRSIGITTSETLLDRAPNNLSLIELGALILEGGF